MGENSNREAKQNYKELPKKYFETVKFHHMSINIKNPKNSDMRFKAPKTGGALARSKFIVSQQCLQYYKS